MFNKKLSLQHFFLFFLLICGFILVIIDQVIKSKIRLNGGFYMCNKGISFGLLLPPLIFWLILAIFLLLSFFYLKHLLKSTLLAIFPLLAAILILSGAFSNIIDRLLFGCITDFITIRWLSFPFFNLADVFIFTGSCFFLLHLCQKKAAAVDK